MEISNKLINRSKYDYLIRFISLSKLLDLLINQAFSFTRLDFFKDKSEAISNQQLIKHLYPKLWNSENTKKELELKIRQQRYFASCWFGSDRESFSMWNLYSDSSSVALRYKVDDYKLLWEKDNMIFNIEEDWINRVYISEIDYKNYLSKEVFKDKKEVIGLYKDESYKSEQEVRVLIKCKGSINKRNKKYFKDLNLEKIIIKPKNIKEIPFTVLFHPEMHDIHKLNIKKLVEKYEFENIRCSDSELTKLLNFKNI